MKTKTPNPKQIKLFEAFAGVGSQHMALKNISNEKGWEIKSAGIVEWFIDAIIAYEAIHNPTSKVTQDFFNDDIELSADSKTPLSKIGRKNKLENTETAFWLNRSKKMSNNLFDIKQVGFHNLPKNIDIFTYSFPCQDLSGQGKGKGMSKESNTRSGLLWEIDRILSEAKDNFSSNEMPKYLLLENVKSMINKNHYSEYQKWLNKLEILGYESHQYVLNSRDFNSPQSRERVFVLSVLKEHKDKVGFEFEEPEMQSKTIPLKSVLEKNIPFEEKFNNFTLIERESIRKDIKKYSLRNYSNFSSENIIFDINYNGATLTASGALSRLKLFYGEKQIRTMTPRECFRYMGFTDKDYEKVVKTNLIKPIRQIYLAGNSIVVNVLEEIFKMLKF